METKDTCDECPEEPSVTEVQTSKKLVCYIQVRTCMCVFGGVRMRVRMRVGV